MLQKIACDSPLFNLFGGAKFLDSDSHIETRAPSRRSLSNFEGFAHLDKAFEVDLVQI
ncbi:hypothetical protein HMPREF0388_1180 [Mobiluncus curtisii ATCC 51333]|uniref:Uncharacterized protein n=1 Tax=Mobiluncus curtisii ATCC 51333 TaxID=887326 RepID=E6LZ93_9ACTO|nr:hypothetical protein HMPREF0388_1180 [Mobiluncus curtisii ATCC 51333]